MPYIIDGHNLIPKVQGLSLSDVDDEIQLIQILQDFCRREGKQAEVFFDNAAIGQARTQKHGRVTAHYIRQGQTADDGIRNRLRKLGASARNWTVVSSDRQVAAASREARAGVISADEFARKLEVSGSLDEITPEIDPDLSIHPDELGDWLKFFEGNEREE